MTRAIINLYYLFFIKIPVLNTRDNIFGGLLIFKYYRDKWISRGYEGELLDKMAFGSYNRGMSGINKYLSNGNSIHDLGYVKALYNRLETIGR